MEDRIWLTYAWKDNEDNDVDFVIAELQRHGLDVGYDRAQLLVGQSLWRQIDAAIADTNLKAWAIYVTENSLRSEPCQEELAYALDRTLRSKGGTFPIIGIFPRALDRSLIPSSIATRLYVDLQSHDWADAVVAGVRQKRPRPAIDELDPYVLTWRKFEGRIVLEARPRTGRWLHSVIAVKTNENHLLLSCAVNPRDAPNFTCMIQMLPFDRSGRSGYEIGTIVTPEMSLYAEFSAMPTEVVIGPINKAQQLINPQIVSSIP